MYRYIFGRVYRQQRRVVGDAAEAYFSSLFFMCIPTLIVGMSLAEFVMRALDTIPMRSERWLASGALFAVLMYLNHVLLGRERRGLEAAHRSGKPVPHPWWGTVLVSLYFVVPIVVVAAVVHWA
jgi:hypothetical protein